MNTFASRKSIPSWSTRTRLAQWRANGPGRYVSLLYLLHGGGFLMKGARRSIWIHGERPVQFDAALGLMADVMRDRANVRLVLSSTFPATVEYLRRAFPDDHACPAPWDASRTVGRFIARLHPQVLMLLDGGRSLGARTLDRILAARIPIAVVGVDRVEDVGWHLLHAAAATESVIRWTCESADVAHRLGALGVPTSSIVVTGALDDFRHPPRFDALRKIAGVDADAPVVIVSGVSRDEEELILAAFHHLRRDHPTARLIVEPATRDRAAALLRRARQRGWRAALRSSGTAAIAEGRWDVTVDDVPGDLGTLMPLARAVVIGGTFSDGRIVEALSAARGSRCPVLVGAACGDDEVRAHASAIRVPSEALAGALCEAIDHEAPEIRGTARSDASRRTAEALRDLLPEAPSARPVDQSWRVATVRERLGASGAGKLAVRAFASGRIDDWPSLSRRLGHPRSVLCLGNGPSSEDPRVEGCVHDCLIRINWRWKDRGVLARPDMVFVGEPSTIRHVDRCVFGVWNISLERALLVRHLVTRGLSPIEYVTLERVSPIIRDHAWPARPTNGALAIVAAAALRPERLVIGGMDLFRHPDGRYPGDVLSRNQYAHVHRESTDLAVVDLALAGFDGELVILSEILRESLARFRERRGELA